MGRALDPVGPGRDTWPDTLEPALRGVDVGIARTMPLHAEQREIREVETLNLAAIAAAREVIYLENQYLASRAVVEALAD